MRRKWSRWGVALSALLLLSAWVAARTLTPSPPPPPPLDPAALDAAMREHARNPIHFHLIPRVWGQRTPYVPTP